MDYIYFCLFQRYQYPVEITRTNNRHKESQYPIHVIDRRIMPSMGKNYIDINPSFRISRQGIKFGKNKVLIIFFDLPNPVFLLVLVNLERFDSVQQQLFHSS